MLGNPDPPRSPGNLELSSCKPAASPDPTPTQSPGPILTSQTTGLRTLALAPAPGNLFCRYWQDWRSDPLSSERTSTPDQTLLSISSAFYRAYSCLKSHRCFFAPVSNRHTHQVYSLLPEEKQSPHSRTRTQSVSFYYYCFILPFDMEQHAALWLYFLSS